MSLKNCRIIHDGKILEYCRDGEIVLLKKWLVQLFQSGEICVYDGLGAAHKLYDYPEYLKKKLQVDNVLELDIFVTVSCPEEFMNLGFMLNNSAIELRYYEPTHKACTCGSFFTDFPSHHSEWCDSNEFE